jgi:hypothetical protein
MNIYASIKIRFIYTVVYIPISGKIRIYAAEYGGPDTDF